MPKIKLSALIADIKGKANGSVFSSNSGGVYFRNNPSGGGRKSANWDKQKSLFSTLATTWRELDNDEQLAWNAIVNEYPTTNAFGDIRIPSGYELFMRLNGTLRSVDLPTLIAPLPAPVFPAIGTIEENFPEQFQYNPTQRFQSWASNDPSSFVSTKSGDYFDAQDIMDDYTFGMRLDFQKVDNYPFSTSDVLALMSCQNFLNFGFQLNLYDANTATPRLVLDVRLQSGEAEISVDLTPEQISSSFHVAFTLPSTGADQSQIYLNGELLVPTVSSSGDQTTGNFTLDCKWFESEDGEQAFGYMSDFRQYNSVLSDDDINLVSNGYILDSEQVLILANYQEDGEIESWSNQSADLFFSIGNWVTTKNYFQAYSAALVPLFTIDVANAGSTDMNMNIYASPPVSNGVTSKITNMKLLGSFTWNVETSFSIHEAVKALYGNVPPNSRVVFEVQPLSKSTGSTPATPSAAARKKPRFKAGSALSSKVN